MTAGSDRRVAAVFTADRLVALGLTTGLAFATARLLGPAGRGQFALALLTASGLGEVAAGGNWLAARHRAMQAGDGQWRDAVRRSGRFAVLLALPAGTAFAAGYRSAPLGLATAFVLWATTASALSRGWAIAHDHLRAYSRSLLVPLVATLLALGVLDALGLATPAPVLAAWGAGLLLARRRLAGSGAGGGPAAVAPAAVPARAHLGLGLSSLLLSFLGYRIDYYVVQLVGSAADVGRYSVGVALAELALVPHSLLATVYASRVARDGGHPGGARPVPFLAVDLAAVAVLGAVMAVAGPHVLRLFFGHAYEGAGSVIPFLIPGLAASCAMGILTIHLNVAAGSYGASSAAAIANCAVTCLAVAVLLGRHGIVGAAVGSSAGYVAGLAVAALAMRRTAELVPAGGGAH